MINVNLGRGGRCFGVVVGHVSFMEERAHRVSLRKIKRGFSVALYMQL